MKNLKLFEILRLNKNGYTIVRQVEDQLRKISGIPYETGTTDYLKNKKNVDKKLYENCLNDERQLREEFSLYRSSLGSPLKSREIQRLLDSRVILKNKQGMVVRDTNTGVIQYSESFQKESYNTYLLKSNKYHISDILQEVEYQSTVVYSNMIDEAEGKVFLLKSNIENFNELSEIIRNK